MSRSDRASATPTTRSGSAILLRVPATGVPPAPSDVSSRPCRESDLAVPEATRCAARAHDVPWWPRARRRARGSAYGLDSSLLKEFQPTRPASRSCLRDVLEQHRPRRGDSQAGASRPGQLTRTQQRPPLSMGGRCRCIKGAPGCAGREGTYVPLKGHCDPQQQIESRTQSTTRIFTPGAWIISPYVSTRRNVETVTLRRRYPTSVKSLAHGSRMVTHQGDWPRLASPPRR